MSYIHFFNVVLLFKSWKLLKTTIVANFHFINTAAYNIWKKEEVNRKHFSLNNIQFLIKNTDIKKGKYKCTHRKII